MSDENGTPVAPTQESTGTPNAAAPPVEVVPPTEVSPTGQEPQAQTQTPPQEAAPPEAPPTNAEGDAPPERVVPAADGYTLPEGIPADFGKFANSLDMTQAQADGVLQAQAGLKQAEMQAVRTAGEAHIKSWGERADYNMNLAKRAMKQHDANGELAKLLNDTGFGNHPAVLDHFFTLGQALQEGGFLKSELKAPGEKTRAQKMFPSMKSETI